MNNKIILGLVTACIITLSSFSFLYQLGSRPFVDYDEAIYAQVLHDTEASKQALTLQYFNNPWFEKPPLYFWASIVAHKIFPTPEFAYRLPSALAGIACVLLTLLILLEVTKSSGIAVLGALATLTSPAFFEAARQVRLDVTVTAFILLALYAFIRGRENSLWYLLVGCAVALAILTKGVIGLFAGPILLIWAISTNDYRWFKNAYFWTGAVLGLAVVVPWHWYEYAHHSTQFWREYLGVHVLERFSHNILGDKAQATNLLYVKHLLTLAMPWSILYLTAVWQMFFMPRHTRAFRAALAFTLQAAFIIVIFLFAGTKIPYYLTPVYPLMIMAVACVVWWFYENAFYKKHEHLVYAGVGSVLAVACIMTIYVGLHLNPSFHNNDIIVRDEKTAGLRIAKSEIRPVYAFSYPYWDTLQYYGQARISEMREDMTLTEPFLLIMHRELYNHSPFPPELSKHFSSIYTGEALVLLQFKP